MLAMHLRILVAGQRRAQVSLGHCSGERLRVVSVQKLPDRNLISSLALRRPAPRQRTAMGRETVTERMRADGLSYS